LVGSIQVEPESLTADALDLADAQVPITPPATVPPAADPVSQGVTAVLEAQSAALTTVVEHSGTLRAHGGATLMQTAASLVGADQDNALRLAAVIGGGLAAAPASATAATSAPPLPPDPVLPEIPALTPPPALPGDRLSALIHQGSGSTGIRDFADSWRAHANTLDEVADQVLARGSAIDQHWIDGAQQAGANTTDHGYWLRESADRARTIADAAGDVADHFDNAKGATPTPEEFDATRREIMASQARRDPIGTAMATRQYADLQAQAIDAATTYHGGVTDATTTLGTPLQTAPAIARGSGARPVDYRTFKQAPALPDGDRHQNEIDAFKQVFGRAPVSANDWDTAAALDPHSYDPKNQGHAPHIVVGRIQPVPGQGVVRSNMFIPGRDVWDPKLGWPPYANNLGDNRGFSPTAGPEDSRVSILVDYDNGLIVARQNPSVNASTGAVRTGTPSVSAVQQSNGSVLINYSAADPFSPGGEGLAKAIPMDVNGTLAITPSATGPHVGGDVTSFPALEVYSDRPGAGTVPLLQSWPSFRADAAGPLAGLLFSKTVGDYSLVTDFNSVFPQLQHPTLPPLLGPPAIPAMPPMTVLPPMNLTPLGSVSELPQVLITDPIHIDPPFLPR
jgi:hypothetical protein